MQESEKAEALIPKLGARAQSLINNKPTQQHRIIKDRANSVIVAGSGSEKRPALVPITNSENIRGSFDSCIQGGPSALLKLEKAGAAGDNDTKDHLRRRIKELEKEVLKLTNHIHAAEMSIKNYRVSLSEKGPRPASQNKDGCTQTDADDTVKLQAALKASQDKLAATVEELRGLKDMKDSLFNERKQLQETNKRKEEFMIVAVQANEDTIAKQKQQIRELEDRVKRAEAASASTTASSISDNSAPFNDNALERMLHQLTITQKLKQELSKTKSQLACEIDFMCIAMRSDYDLLLEKVVQKAQESRIQHLQQRQTLVKENARLAAQLNSKDGELTTARAEIQSLTLLAESLEASQLKPRAETGTNTVSQSPERRAACTSTATTPIKTAPLLIEIPVSAAVMKLDRCLSPLSPLAHRHTTAAHAADKAQQAANAAAAIQADQQIQAKLRLAEKDAELDQLKRRIEQDRVHLLHQSDDLDALRTRLLSERERFDKICTDQEHQLAQRTAQYQNERLRADALQVRLQSASQALAGLQEVHQAEVKAVKHEAHVKDLLRVAKEREAALEKDKLQIELKHNK